MGFDPLLWFKFEEIEDKSELEEKVAKTAQIVEEAVEHITTILKRLITERKIYGTIKTNPDKSGSCFIKGKDENEILKTFENDLLDIEKFLKEFYPTVIFTIPPTIIRKLDKIIAEAKRYSFDLFVKKALDLKNLYFKKE